MGGELTILRAGRIDLDRRGSIECLTKGAVCVWVEWGSELLILTRESSIGFSRVDNC